MPEGDELNARLKALQHLEAAQKATEPAIKAEHLNMAQSYNLLIEVAAKDRLTGLMPVAPAPVDLPTPDDERPNL